MASASSYKAANERAIDYAAKSFKIDAEVALLDGMERLANAALDYLVEAHNAHAMFMSHVTETDTMAWALARDGRIRRSGFHNGGEQDLPGSAMEKAMAIASQTHGWAVVILSDMEGWYREDYEMDFMVDAQFGIAENFHTFFKKAK